MTSGEILGDIRMRLEGLPQSVLHGDNGLAAATMRSLKFHEQQVEKMRAALSNIAAMATQDVCTELVWRTLGVIERAAREALK